MTNASRGPARPIPYPSTPMAAVPNKARTATSAKRSSNASCGIKGTSRNTRTNVRRNIASGITQRNGAEAISLDIYVVKATSSAEGTNDNTIQRRRWCQLAGGAGSAV